MPLLQGQRQIIGGHFGANCTGFCSARFETPRIPVGRRKKFRVPYSPLLFSTPRHGPGFLRCEKGFYQWSGVCGSGGGERL